MSEPRDIEIIGFEERYAKEFADLNYEWIATAYSIERHDREILDNPVEQIIAPGGQVFFAMDGCKPVGTVALIAMDDDSFELAKMAVSPECRGLGIGNLLMAACVDHARISGKRFIILESNTRQTAAIELYRKFGFSEAPLDPNSQFARANIRMRLDLDAP
jgi:ribosomal protein S18 acetylase RimI-like enzyme